jgi:hypothetical protein
MNRIEGSICFLINESNQRIESMNTIHIAQATRVRTLRRRNKYIQYAYPIYVYIYIHNTSANISWLKNVHGFKQGDEVFGYLALEAQGDQRGYPKLPCRHHG